MILKHVAQGGPVEYTVTRSEKNCTRSTNRQELEISIGWRNNDGRTFVSNGYAFDMHAVVNSTCRYSAMHFIVDIAVLQSLLSAVKIRPNFHTEIIYERRSSIAIISCIAKNWMMYSVRYSISGIDRRLSYIGDAVTRSTFSKVFESNLI